MEEKFLTVIAILVFLVGFMIGYVVHPSVPAVGGTVYNREITFTEGIKVDDGELKLGGTAITATASELNTLDGITATVSELNILDGVTATANELNILDGATLSTSELNILDGVTADASELNTLDGVLNATTTWDPGSLATSTGETKSLTVTGAALGDFCLVSAPYDLQDMSATCYVQAASTTEIRLFNTGDATVDLDSGTWRVLIIPQ